MPMAKRSLRWLFLCPLLLLSSALFAQMGNFTYAANSTVSVQPNIGNCASQNCWHASSALLSQIASVSGFTVGLNTASNKVYVYNDYPTDTWTEKTGLEGMTVNGIAVATLGAGEAIYGIGPNNGTAGGAIYYSVSPYTSWTLLDSHQTFTRVTGAADGTVVALTGAYPAAGFVAYSAYYWTGSTWSVLPSVSNGWKQIAVTVYPNFLGLDRSANLYSCNSTSCSTFSPSIGLSTGIASVSADPSGNLIATTGTSNAYYFSASLSSWFKAETSSSWTGFTANGGPWEMWAIGNIANNNNVYRFMDQTLVHTRTLTGTSTCPNNNCQNATHTGVIQASWVVNGTTQWGPQASSGPIYPESQMNVGGSAWLDDPYECFGPQANCFVGAQGNVNCSIMGQIYSDPGPNNGSGIWKYSRGKVTGTSDISGHSATYTLTDYCTANTTPPALHFGGNMGANQSGPYDPHNQGNPITVGNAEGLCLPVFDVCVFKKMTLWYMQSDDPGPLECSVW